MNNTNQLEINLIQTMADLDRLEAQLNTLTIAIHAALSQSDLFEAQGILKGALARISGD